MSQQYTAERQFPASVTIVFVNYLKSARHSPSLQLRDAYPNDTSSMNLEVIQNTLPWEDLSVADTPGEAAQPSDYARFQEAKKYFEENKAQILEKYKGNFISILDNAVVDHDTEFSKLAKRVYEKFGYQSIYMPFVESEPRVLRIPSPRVGKPPVNALRKEI